MDVKVYLAGKITNSFWREAIIRRCSDVTDRKEYFNGVSVGDGFIVNGPHSVRCDHSCYHFNDHAAEEGDYDCIGLHITKHEISKACISQINKSDFVFAYIESMETYGTIAEIGYAVGKGIPVYVLYKNSDIAKNMWFVSEMSAACYVANNDVQDTTIRECFKSAIRSYEATEE